MSVRRPETPERREVQNRGDPVQLPEGMHLRLASRQDRAAIRGLVRRARINPMGLDWRRFVVVQEARGEVVACGQVKPHGDGTRELASLVVTEGWRGKGLGRDIIEHLQRQSGPPLWLTCREGLVPLYTRFGFRRVQHPGDLSPYFRRLDRVAKAILRVLRPGEGLAIMLWPESCTSGETWSTDW